MRITVAEHVFPVIEAWLDGHLGSQIEQLTSSLIAVDPKLSPIRARELAGAELASRFVAETGALDDRIRGYLFSPHPDCEALYDSVTQAMEDESFLAAVQRLTGTRTLIADMDGYS